MYFKFIAVTFQQERGARLALHPEKSPGAVRYFDGPLLLDSAIEMADESLMPIPDLMGQNGNGAENMSIIRKIALNKLKTDSSVKASLKSKRNMAAWDPNYALNIMSQMMR